jgi:FMN-dependent NADH-azoreductase
MKPPLEVISSSHQNKFSDNEIKNYKQAHKLNEVITLDSSIDEIPITSKKILLFDPNIIYLIITRYGWRSKWVH